MPQNKINISVIVVTKGEAANLPRCLRALEPFDDIVVVDSPTKDGSEAITQSLGARYVPFEWNGAYPKKRQWCLDHLPLKHDRVFFVDADEEVTSEICNEIAALDWNCAGYFVKGRYVVAGRVLRFGLCNDKLCLFDRRLMVFPVVDDLSIPGMGEIEGHYQPVLKDSARDQKIGRLKEGVLHHAMDDGQRYAARHDGYAQWEHGMREKNLYPLEPVLMRRALKKLFSVMPKSSTAFIHSYIIKAGFLDGKPGLCFALSRYDYYKNVSMQRLG